MSNAAAAVPPSPFPTRAQDAVQRSGTGSPSHAPGESGIGQSVAEVKAQFRAGSEAVREGLNSAVTHAKDRAYDLAEEQKQVASEGIDKIARAIHETADGLREQTPGVAQYVDSAASGIGRASQNLKATSVDDVLGAVQDFARRQPVAFFVGAGLAGLMIARLIQASAGRRTVPRGMVRSTGDRDWPVGNRPGATGTPLASSSAARSELAGRNPARAAGPMQGL